MKYQDEDEESKEIDQINKDIENNLKLEITINKNLEETDKFIKKYEWKILGDNTHHFKQDIELIWKIIIQSLDSNSIINKNYPIIIKKGSNIWNLGNIFEGKLFDMYEFSAKVIKQKIYSELKKIEWIMFLENGEDLRIKINLYKVTEDNSTVLHMITKYIPLFGENLVFKIQEKFKAIDYLKTIEKMLEKESVILYQYESGIIPGNMEQIWDFLTDCSKLVLIAPNNECFVPININNVKMGDICNIPMNIKDIEGSLNIKLDLNEKKNGLNKWAFGYSILGGLPFKVVKQSIIVQLTKINKYETQLSIFTKIYDSISMKLFQRLSQKKKYVISSFKDYFENFSTPQDNDINN